MRVKNYHMVLLGAVLFVFAQIVWHLTAIGVI
jgi:hypothetical protein